MKTEKGRLYVIEGPDGVGKTTLSLLFAEFLRRQGRECIQLSFPGREPGTLGALVYSLHHDPASQGIERITPSALQALHVAAHIDVIERSLIPTLHAGADVVLDRYWWSTLVYGSVGGAKRKVIDRLIEAERASWCRAKPSAVFVLRRDRPLGLPHTEHWDRLVDAYAALAEAEGGTVINNSGTLEEALQAMDASVQHEAKDRAEERDSAASNNVSLHTRLSPAQPTKVLDTY